MKYNRLFFVFRVLAIAAAFGIFSHGVGAAQIAAGPMAGAAGMRAATLWVQADGAANAQIEYWFDKEPARIMRTAVQKLYEAEDYAVHFSIGGLEPGRTYGYRVKLNGKVALPNEKFFFRTQALWQWRTDPPDWKLAFGSCMYLNEPAYDRPGKPYGGPPETRQIFASIAREKPDMMLWGGDSLYFREVDYDSEWGLRYRWRRDRGIPELQSILRTAHHYAIWDDHEFGPNDSNSSYVFKDIALKLFKRYWANPSYGLPEAPGIFTTFSFNDADFFLLDNRYYRDSEKLKGEDKTKLGAVQLRWLKNALLASKASIKIILAGSQMTNAVNQYEGWDKFSKERDDIFKFLLDQQIDGVLLFSGDRHFTEMLKTERPGSYPLYELTCSPLTSGVPSNLDQEKINPQIVPGTFTAQRNFCTLDFQGAKDERKIVVRNFSTEGKKLWEQTIAVRELKTPLPSR